MKLPPRVQRQNKSLVDYIGELRMLASRAFPGWSEEQRDILIRNQFIQGVLSSSIQVQLMKEMPKTGKDAVLWHAGWKRWRKPIGIYNWKEVWKDVQQTLHLSPRPVWRISWTR